MALELNRKNEKKLSPKEAIEILEMTPEEREAAGIYIKNEVSNRKLQSPDGKYFGEISYDAYKAIENGTLDRYRPLKSEEKIIAEYRKYPSIPLVSEDGKTFGYVSYDAYQAIKNGNISEYTPYSEAEKKVITDWQKETETTSTIGPPIVLDPPTKAGAFQINLDSIIYILIGIICFLIAFLSIATAKRRKRERLSKSSNSHRSEHQE